MSVSRKVEKEVEDAAQTINSEHETQEKEPRTRTSGGEKRDQLKKQMHLCFLRKAAPLWPGIHPTLQTTVISSTFSCEV